MREQRQGLSPGLDLLERMVREALAFVRLSMDEQLPDVLVGVLAKALSRLVEETAERLGLSSRISFSGVDEQGHSRGESLSPGAERLMYLVARELLYQLDAKREARRLRLILNYETDDVLMSIEDDGQTLISNEAGNVPIFQPAPPLANLLEPTDADEAYVLLPIINDLRYRIEHLGGTLEILKLPERGTRTLVRLPYVLQSVSGDEAISLPSFPQVTREASLTANGAIQGDKVPAIRLLLVESQAVTRVGLRHLLTAYEGIQVIGEAADGVQAVSEALELGPQVVLMDTQLPNGQSLEALRQIKQLNLDCKVLLFAAEDREESLYEALRAGADGYILKDITPDDLLQAVRAVARGEILIQPQIAGRLLSRFGRQGRNTRSYDSLTARELEVSALAGTGTAQ